MLIVGDISGIHDFVTNVAHVGGGQARRLRARSFYVQLLCEAAAVELLDALGWPIDREHLVMSAAGHFVLRGPACDESEATLVRREAELNRWLLDELSGEARLSLGWCNGSGTEIEQFQEARRRMNGAQLRPWSSVAHDGGGWDVGRMVLAPLDTPCPLCQQRPATITVADEDTGEEREICGLCWRLKELGRKLTDAREVWLRLSRLPEGTERSPAALDAFSLVADLAQVMPNPRSVVAVTKLDEPEAGAEGGPFAAKWLRRRLARYVPTDDKGRTLDFTAIARQSKGDAKLGVLMADGDGMGEFWEALLANSSDLASYAEASGSFDEFSARELNALLSGAADDPNSERRAWRSIYTVYSGGDDLFFIGPWNVMLDFAGSVRELFMERFGRHGLSLSAGLAIVHARRPIKRMAAVAEELLEHAKKEAAEGHADPKDQLAALGSVWKWSDHAAILADGRQWAGWVESGLVERGWLHTCQEMNEARRGRRNRAAGGDDATNELMASARLDYLIERRFPQRRRRGGRPAPQREELQDRLAELLREFESPRSAVARQLSSSLAYALLATRTPREE